MQTFRDLKKHLGLVPSQVAAALADVEASGGREEAFRRQNPDVLETLVEVARIQSTEASNAIENIVAPHQRIVELVEEKTTPDNRSEQEIAGYRLVLDMIHSSADAIPFKASIDLQFHRDLYSFTSTPGGKWKSTQNEVAQFDAQGNKIGVIFKGERARIHQFIRSRVSDEFTFEDLSHALPDISAVHIRQEMRKLHKAGVVESPGRGGRTWKRLQTDF